MSWMFANCNFKGDNIKNWDIHNAKNISYMFYNCPNFNTDLNNWKIGNDVNMRDMFTGCNSLLVLPKWFSK